ncbi:GxxExxY protein [Phenylobacterium sp. LjRoot225]|uniref:GxxExxY protein n=1 Tax=Phenylobacterium sp. LjRoot225 TaxID=3342285 RepID=UPI003ECF5112
MVHEKHEKHEKVLYADEAYAIQGAIFDVYRTMGAGFLENVYQECLALEFSARRISFRALEPLRLGYKGHPLRQTYTPDFVCFDRIILELKALRALAPEHQAQTINYLRASGLRLGLLVNFGSTPKVQIERFAI